MERYERYYRSLFTVAMAINSSLEFKKAMQTVVQQVAEAMEVKGASIRLLNKSGKKLLPGTNFGLSKHYMRKGPVDVDKSGVDREALVGNDVYIADVTTDERFQYKEAAKAEGIVSLLVLPLEAHGKVIGVMRFYSDRSREFDPEERKFASSVAALSALALENARLYKELKRDFETLTSFEYRIFED